MAMRPYDLARLQALPAVAPLDGKHCLPERLKSPVIDGRYNWPLDAKLKSIIMPHSPGRIGRLPSSNSISRLLKKCSAVSF